MVSLPARAEAQLIATCEPQVIKRGEVVHCTARVEPRERYQLVSRTALIGAHRRREQLLEWHAAGEVSDWEGPAVLSTRVLFVAKVASSLEELSAETSFHVEPRKFPRLRLSRENQRCEVDTRAHLLSDPPALANGSTREEPTPGPGALSRVTLELPPPSWELVDRGPDTFWYYVRAPATEPPALRTLVTRAFQPGDSFYRGQHSDRSLPSRLGGLWPHCRQVDMERMRDELMRGEGCTAVVDARDDSRQARIDKLLAEAIDVNGVLEEIAVPLINPEAKENPFARVVSAQLAALSKEVLTSPAAQPSGVHLTCRLRYPPEDPK